MGLESATFIHQLDPNNPVGATDQKAQGDDHIRMIKAALQATFPNIDGALTPSHTELNLLDGLTADAAELNQLDGFVITIGTYAPTLTNNVNVDSVTATGGSWHYIRLGTIVAVFGQFLVDPAGATLTSFFATLPVASDLAGNQDIVGAAATIDGTNQRLLQVQADSVNNRANIAFVAAGSSVETRQVFFVYKIK